MAINLSATVGFQHSIPHSKANLNGFQMGHEPGKSMHRFKIYGQKWEAIGSTLCPKEGMAINLSATVGFQHSIPHSKANLNGFQMSHEPGKSMHRFKIYGQN